MILSGIIYVQYTPSHDPKVNGLLVAGFASLVFFGLWETFAHLKQPLTPTRLFTANKGRSLTAPFVVGFVVTMFYYGTNITWPTMLGVYFTSAATPFHIILLLATVQGFGIFTGAMILSFGGSHFQHWKWQMTVPIALMTIFGGLLAVVTPGQEGMGIAFAYLSATAYGYAQYLSIAYIQFGADQVELGIAGGLAGVARYAGGAVAVTLYETILITVQSAHAMTDVPAAAEAAGASPTVAAAVLAALPLGAAALEKVQGLTLAIAEAAGGAFVNSYVQGVRYVTPISSPVQASNTDISQSCSFVLSWLWHSGCYRNLVLGGHRAKDEQQDRDLSRKRRSGREEQVSLTGSQSPTCFRGLLVLPQGIPSVYTRLFACL